MSVPTPEQGRFSKLYNEVADELLQANVTLRQLKLALAIIRLSYGESASASDWTSRPVTIAELASRTRLDRKDAERTLKQMRSAGMIERQDRPDGIYWRYCPGWSMGANHPHGGKTPPYPGGDSPPEQITPNGGEIPPHHGGELPPPNGGETPPSRNLQAASEQGVQPPTDRDKKDTATTAAAALPADLVSTLQRQVSKRLVLMKIYELFQQYGEKRLRFAGARVEEERRQRLLAGRDALENPVALFMGILRSSTDEEAEAYFEELASVNGGRCWAGRDPIASADDVRSPWEVLPETPDWMRPKSTDEIDG